MTTISALSSANTYLNSASNTASTSASDTSTTASDETTSSATTKEDALAAVRKTISSTSLSLDDYLDSNDSSSFFEDSASISEQAQSLLDAYNSST